MQYFRLLKFCQACNFDVIQGHIRSHFRGNIGCQVPAKLCLEQVHACAMWTAMVVERWVCYHVFVTCHSPQVVPQSCRLFQLSLIILSDFFGCQRPQLWSFLFLMSNFDKVYEFKCGHLIIMAVLRSRCGHYIFALWFLLSSYSFLFPHLLSRQRLDVYHTSTHGVSFYTVVKYSFKLYSFYCTHKMLFLAVQLMLFLW